MIYIVDTRHGPLKLDGSNVDGGMNVVNAVDAGDIVVEVSQDGIWVKRGTGKVAIITPKGEDDLSAEKSAAESARFEEMHRRDGMTAEDPMAKVRRALGGEQ